MALAEPALTEEQIERSVEHKFDSLDKIYMMGRIDEKEYRLRSNAITKWANAQARNNGER